MHSMDQHIDSIKTRLDAVYEQIFLIRNRRNQGDLFAMLHTVERILKKISQESVVCRQRKRNTPKYNDLVQQCTEALEMLEKYVIFASLMNT
jgi:hypothetical protein